MQIDRLRFSSLDVDFASMLATIYSQMIPFCIDKNANVLTKSFNEP